MAGMVSTNERKLSLWRKMAIGGGDFGLNLYWQSSSLFLLYFYTEILGIPAATAGLIYMSALIWDAVIDPVVGVFADRTRTRFGRYRPYLIFGSVPLAAVFLLVFWLPSGSGKWLVALTVVSHFLFRTLYAVVAIPYASLFAQVTRDSGERATMAGIRMVFALVSAILVSAVTLPLALALGSGVRGWTLLAASYGMLACLFLWAAAHAAARDGDGESEAVHAWPGLSETFRAMAGNRALLIVLGVVFFSSFAYTFFSKNMLYYFKYIRENAELGGAALAGMAAVAALAAPVWAQVARRRSKRFALLVGLSLYATGIACWYAGSGAALGVLAGSLVLIALGNSALYVCFWAMLPDTIEYGEWRTGIRSEALVFGCAVFVQKAALGLGAGALGLSLSGIGFVPNAVQSESTRQLLIAMMAAIPFAGAVVTILLASRYPIDPATHRTLVKEIADRSAANDPASPASGEPDPSGR